MKYINDYGSYEKNGEDYSVLGPGDGFTAYSVAYGDIDYLNKKFLDGEFKFNSSYNAILHDEYGEFVNYPQELQDNALIALSAVSEYGYNYGILSPELQDDRDILVATARYFVEYGDDEGILAEIMEEHANDKDFFLTCAYDMGFEEFIPKMFDQFSDEIKNDVSVMSDLLFNVESERDVEIIKEYKVGHNLFNDETFKAIYDNIIMGESVDKVVEAYENKHRNEAIDFLNYVHEAAEHNRDDYIVIEPSGEVSIEKAAEMLNALEGEAFETYFNSLPDDMRGELIQDAQLNQSVKEWYMSEFPDDELSEYINDDLSFVDVANGLNENKDIYDEIIGVGDSIVRERIFDELSDRLNTDYSIINNKSMLGDMAPDIEKNQAYDDKYLKAFISLDGMNLCHTYEAERSNKELVELAVSKDPDALRYASEDIIKEYLKEDGRNLKHLFDKQRNDKELVNIALESSSVAMYHVGDALRKDRDFVKESVAKYPNALYFLNEYKDNKPLVMRAVMADGLALKFASERLQDDKSVVMAAVKTYGPALEFASPKLKDDFEVVVEAMKTSKSAVLKYASDRVKTAIESQDKTQNSLEAKLKQINSMRKDAISTDKDKGPKEPER